MTTHDINNFQKQNRMAHPKQYYWWHALMFGIAANIVSGIGLGRQKSARDYYESMHQAPFAPPTWVFGPAWALNNISVLWGNLRLLNLDETTPYRRRLLWLQGASWILFSSFSYVYFRKRSVILALIWTASMYVLTIASVVLSIQVDRKIALSLVTLLLWLTLATPVALYQALRNPDHCFGTSAFC